jgi:AcrR family transcriptional regulator
MSRNGQNSRSVQHLENDMKVKNDRRSQRTRQALGDALLELMAEKGYETLSIKDIIERANVGRSTFYAHYADKEDLFVSQMAHMVERLDQETPQNVSGTNPYFPSLGLFQHFGEQWKLYKILSWKGGTDLLTRHLQKSISEQIEQNLVAGGWKFEAPIPLVANFLTGSFLSMLKWWLDNKMMYSPEQMDTMFRKLALPGIAQMTANS